MQRETYLTPLFGLAFVSLGYAAAEHLMGIAGLQASKVLNFVGVSCDVAGLVLLSKHIAHSTRYKLFIVDRLAPQVINFFGGFPTGMMIGAVMSGGPSQAVVREFASGLQLSLAVAALVASRYLSRKRVAFAKGVDRAVSLIGGFFLAGGLGLQLLASVLDMHTK